MTLRYESYLADQPGGNRRIADYLGLAPDEFREPPTEPRTIPYDAKLEDIRCKLVERFRARCLAEGNYFEL